MWADGQLSVNKLGLKDRFGFNILFILKGYSGNVFFIQKAFIFINNGRNSDNKYIIGLLMIPV